MLEGFIKIIYEMVVIVGVHKKTIFFGKNKA
jgi:hypothetical protein